MLWEIFRQISQISLDSMRKKLVVLSGAGISAESGIRTFRDTGGLWENYDILDVASPMGWAKNPALVLDFYNQRRRQLFSVEPNAGHKALAELEKYFDVVIITQNVDNLHERAGSTNVLHLHGELLKVRSTLDPNLVYHWEKDLHLGDKCEKGSQLRPHIVWFYEEVPMMEVAAIEAQTADIFMVVGTSMVVYPAAGLINYVAREVPKFVIDVEQPNINLNYYHNLTFIQEKAGVALPKLAQKLIETYAN
ncbi:SIR2 family NAD-dependent protein deacylase [Raineya orbicola]|jgi:NAD-dependent deacetylase|uniref:NAD-dependent protein deacylase n=1 Tax=Raineya orbicola TaxID=2016530 RepID=A0A2N3IKK8_9BACT|nr:NAD-dependent deacylase [Raineya orbicola]PKQ70852.1 NAD-dependent protein deacetylases SIR2 family [Raineya orbicola]